MYEADRYADWDPDSNPELVDRIEDPVTDQDYALANRYDRGDRVITSAFDRQYEAMGGGSPGMGPVAVMAAVAVMAVLMLVALATIIF